MTKYWVVKSGASYWGECPNDCPNDTGRGWVHCQFHAQRFGSLSEAIARAEECNKQRRHAQVFRLKGFKKEKG
jgi:hypothetical protein